MKAAAKPQHTEKGTVAYGEKKRPFTEKGTALVRNEWASAVCFLYRIAYLCNSNEAVKG